MSRTSGYNGNTDFLKWYKTHYGADYDENTELVRKAGMSDGDWNVGTILQNYYIRDKQNETQRTDGIGKINDRYDEIKDTVIEGYDLARERLGAGKSAAQQNAAITYQKLQKYLPMRQRAEGLGGLGTESAGIDAYNRYMSQMGGIESDYQSNMTAIDESQTSNIGEIERSRAESIEEKNALHDTLAREYASDADSDSRDAWDKYLKGVKEGQDDAYNMAIEILKSSTATDAAELLAYVSNLRGKTSPEQYAALERYATNVANANSKTKTDADQAAAAEIAEIVINGMLDSGDYESAQEYLNNNKALLGSATVDAYQGVIDSHVNGRKKSERVERIISGKEAISHNGQLYKIGGTFSGDIYAFLGSDRLQEIENAGYGGPYDPNLPDGMTFKSKNGNQNITYYDGKWYLSSPVNNTSSTPTATKGVSGSDAILHTYGVGAAQDPAATAGQWIGSLISKYIFGK